MSAQNTGINKVGNISYAIHIHNAPRALKVGEKFFHFPGIEYYADRGVLVQGQQVVVPKGIREGAALGWIEWLEYQVGLKMAEIIEVEVGEEGDLYEAIAQDEWAQQRIDDLLLSGQWIEFFNTLGDIEAKFMEKEFPDHSWNSKVGSAPCTVADTGNNKGTLRQIFPNIFPDHRICTTKARALEAFRELIQQYDEIIIKLPMYASSMGQMIISSEEGVHAFYEQYADAIEEGVTKVIVERFLGEIIDMSHVIKIENGKMVASWSSLQSCTRENGTIRHNGNAIGHDLPDITDEDREWMGGVTKRVTEEFISLGLLNGYLCLDCAKRKESGDWYVLEANIRFTVSTYLWHVLGQVKKHSKKEPIGIYKRVDPKDARTFQEVADCLGVHMYNKGRGSGVIPVQVRCLEHGYCYIIVIEESWASAFSLLQVVEEELGHKQS